MPVSVPIYIYQRVQGPEGRFNGVEVIRGGEKFQGWGEGRWDGECLEMEERECSSDRGSRGRSPLASKRPTEGRPCC